ncbi:hypothetical protein Acsp02_85290 [Actinoplanes sp. NBRC 103695]|nr:hypothetical protein Acsp02_85290 [Actinoplanes sp. NBRC 103695]
MTHWSSRLLADHLTREGTPVSFAEVARIWRDWGLQPHRAETFKFSTDPQLEAKIRDVIGLYLDPPVSFNALLQGTGVVDDHAPPRSPRCSRRRPADAG